MPNVPYIVDTVAMDGTVKTINIDKKWNTVVLKMREIDVLIEIRDSPAATKYLTIAVGQNFNVASHNYSAGDTQDVIYVKAASGTLEVLGYLRG